MSSFFSNKSLTKTLKRTIRTARSNVGLKLPQRDLHNTVQSIYTDAVNKYNADFKELLSAINYFNETDIDYAKVSRTVEYHDVYKNMGLISKYFRPLINTMRRKFTHCKSECERLRPEIQKDLATLAEENPYGYVNSCKGVELIEDCFKFTALFSMFEKPLVYLYLKFDNLPKEGKKYSSQGIFIHISRFLENFDDFADLTKIKETTSFIKLSEKIASKRGGGKRTRRRLTPRRHIRRTYKN